MTRLEKQDAANMSLSSAVWHFLAVKRFSVLFFVCYLVLFNVLMHTLAPLLTRLGL